MDERGRREQTRACQRAWRASHTRIDLYADPITLAAMELRREPWGVMSTNSGTLNAIVREWAELKGYSLPTIKPGEPVPEFRQQYAGGRAGANDSAEGVSVVIPLLNRGSGAAVTPTSPPARLAGPQLARVPCGAKRRRDGLPCEAPSVPGKRRCRWHGGCSTGPKTAEGKARVTRNLPRREY